MNNKIKKNGIITFEYDMYDKNGNWMTHGGPVKMVVGSDDILVGLSDVLIGLDYTIRNHVIDFKYYPNKHKPTFQQVNLNLEIHNYNDYEDMSDNNGFQNDNGKNNYKTELNVEQQEDEHSNTNDSKNIKKAKKEIKSLQKEVEDLSAKINELNKNEALLNKKILEISQTAQQKIEEFKVSYKETYENKLSDTRDYQLQSFFEKFLGPLNNLYMAVEFGVKGSNNPEVIGYVKGFELLVDQMFSVINNFGITIIEPKIGDDFNPELHNILELVESKEYNKDKIIEIKNRGYKLNERVIFPANVFVSTNKSN
ncbi:MAG: nucleotide exchange factor GrpE [Metamycoplasmataceae bacterium]